MARHAARNPEVEQNVADSYRGAELDHAHPSLDGRCILPPVSDLVRVRYRDDLLPLSSRGGGGSFVARCLPRSGAYSCPANVGIRDASRISRTDEDPAVRARWAASLPV